MEFDTLFNLLCNLKLESKYTDGWGEHIERYAEAVKEINKIKSKGESTAELENYVNNARREIRDQVKEDAYFSIIDICNKALNFNNLKVVQTECLDYVHARFSKLWHHKYTKELDILECWIMLTNKKGR
jgi:uncharacterized protein YpuA (DUF1002 family)